MVAALAAVVLLAIGLLQSVRPGQGASPAPALPAETDAQADEEPEVPIGRDGVPQARVDGNVVTLGDRRYEVGEPGDIVVVGDWDCDGTDTPALLRPASGGLFVFERWAEGSPMEVTPVRVVADAVGLRGLEEPRGCDRLVVRRQDGSEVAVRAEHAA